MIITITAPLDIDTARLTWAERRLVRYLSELHERQGDVLLFGMARAIRMTGMTRGVIERGLAALAKQQVVEAMAA
jgi:hypothetical protein